MIVTKLQNSRSRKERKEEVQRSDIYPTSELTLGQRGDGGQC